MTDDDATRAPQDEAESAGRLEEALVARRQKLDRLRARGVDPFALGFDGPIDALAELRERFGDLPAGTDTDTTVRVAGRIVLLRKQGKLSFATLRDRTGDLQLFMTRDGMGDGYELVEDLDLGDLVGAEGPVMTTKRGELSVRVGRLTLLTKALRPLPEKWHGLKDPDLQQRKRHLHLATDPLPRFYAESRARMLHATRRYLDERGFLEVETPVLQSVAGGALAEPFVTHHRVLDVDLFLRISLELYLKRLLVGGLERVYEIGRNFRNEGIDRTHNPEFTMLEVYQAYGGLLHDDGRDARPRSRDGVGRTRDDRRAVPRPRAGSGRRVEAHHGARVRVGRGGREGHPRPYRPRRTGPRP